MQDGFVKVAAASPKVRVANVAYNAQQCIGIIRKASEAGAKVVVLPELCLTGATCGDLFWQDELLDATEAALTRVAHDVAECGEVLVFVGAPLRVGGKLYNCAVALEGGMVRGIVPKRALSAAEARHFAPGSEDVTCVDMPGTLGVPFGTKQLFAVGGVPSLVVAAEVGDDLRAPIPPSTNHALAGATVVVNLAAAPVLVGSAEAMRVAVASQSGRLTCAYVYAGAGAGESTTDYVYGGQCLVAECGDLLAEARPFGKRAVLVDVDVDLIASERRRATSFQTAPHPEASGYHVERLVMEPVETKLRRYVDPYPFIPDDDSERAARCEEILDIQSYALAGRMEAISCTKAVVGISGGLDSTLALLVTARAFDLLGLERAGIMAITMPGFGTTDRTHDNAWQLALALGATPREIRIGASVRQHFADIDHDESVHNAAYENAQARERTQILMDVANDEGGIVVGTGDLSELALGWATYNGDHMSMYAVNAAVPKTLIRYIVRHGAETCDDEHEARVLLDVLDTPVSPELLPANEDGTIAQQTEDLVGPYELHDFFVYQVLRYGMRPRKVYRLALAAFGDTYNEATILAWLKVFYRRFFSQQFKRSCSPDGPAVGSVGLSPRGGLVMPSDATSALWLAELERL